MSKLFTTSHRVFPFCTAEVSSVNLTVTSPSTYGSLRFTLRSSTVHGMSTRSVCVFSVGFVPSGESQSSDTFYADSNLRWELSFVRN